MGWNSSGTMQCGTPAGGANPAGSDGDIQIKSGTNLAPLAQSTFATPSSVASAVATETTRATAAEAVKQRKTQANILDYGAVCDGTTDDTAALQAALTALGGIGSRLIVPGFGSGCYIANPTSITWPSLPGSFAIYVQGKLKLGTTFGFPDWVDLFGDNGGLGIQFQGAGKIAEIAGPNTTGTLGSSCSAGVSCTFTPSTMTGLYRNTAITVAGKSSCTITSIARASNIVTATMSGACHIAPGFAVTVAGVTDTGFNGTFRVGYADYSTNTLTWNQTAADATSSGGTGTGWNEDTVDTALLTATTGSTATATFTHAHTSADTWGIVAIYVTGQGHHQFSDLNISSSGTAIWLKDAAMFNFDNVAATAHNAYSQAIEVDESNWGYFHKVVFLMNGSDVSWAMRITNDDQSASTQAGFMFMHDSTLMGGIKVDRAGATGFGAFHVYDTTFEQTSRGALTWDSSAGNYLGAISFHDSGTQDNFAGFHSCMISYLYPAGTGDFLVDNGGGSSSCIANSNVLNDVIVRSYHGVADPHGAAFNESNASKNAHGGTTQYHGLTETELRGSGANFSPSLIPYQTANVTPVTSLSTGGGCTVTQGVLAPNGNTHAATLTGSGSRQVYNGNAAWAVGDWILFGGWVRAASSFGLGATASGGTITLGGDGFGTVTYDSGTYAAAEVGGFTMPIANDWWTPVAGATRVTAVMLSGGTADASMTLQCNSGGISYYNPWFIRIPASANVPANEIARWRQQLMHGYVAPNVAAGTLSTFPTAVINWGGDTNLYRDGANGLKTDNTFNSSKLEQNGTPLANVALSGDFLDLKNHPLQTSVVAAWPMTEGSGGTLGDLSWSGNNLTATSGSWTGLSGSMTNSITFNGSTTRLDATNQSQVNFSNTQPFTASTWAYLASDGNYYTFVGNLDNTNNYIGWELGTTPCLSTHSCLTFNLVHSLTNLVTLVANSNIPTAGWHMLTATYDGSSTAGGVTLYMDGSAAAASATANSLTLTAANTKNLRFGMREDGSSNKLPNGSKIGATYIWNRVLSASEVSALYASPYAVAVPAGTASCTLPNVVTATTAGGVTCGQPSNVTGTAAGLSAAYIDWNSVSGGASILNKPTLLTSPLTTKGDVWVYGTGNARLPVGTDAQCLVADSTQTLGVKWGSCGTTIGNQNANLVYAGPTSGGAAAPTFRSLVLADMPARPFVISAEWNGIPPSAQVLRTFIVPTYSTTALTITIPANCSEFGANVGTAATGSTAFTVKKNGTTICTLTVSASCTGTSCATAGTGGSQTTLTSNDVLTIVGGGDATLAGVSFSISASATGGAL